jgi:hypothetical protein
MQHAAKNPASVARVRGREHQYYDASMNTHGGGERGHVCRRDSSGRHSKLGEAFRGNRFASLTAKRGG